MNQVGLFAKFWQPGRVKTRLAADLDDKSACQIYQYFLSHLVSQLDNVGDRRTIVYSPGDRKTDFQAAAGACWQTFPQSDGDLGQRMKVYFEHSLQVDAGEQDSDAVPVISASSGKTLDQPIKIGKTIVIGSDCPQLSASDIEHAFAQLDHEPVVLGPSNDGGYYLIGMRGECVDVFENIDWSTERVLGQTRDRLKSLGVRWTELDQKSDIDNLESLLSYHSDAKEASQLGDPDFILLGAIDGVLAEHRRRGDRV